MAFDRGPTPALADRPSKSSVNRVEPPASVIPSSDGLWGLASLAVAWSIGVSLRLPPFLLAGLLLFSTAIPMLLCELPRVPAVRRLNKQPTSPLLWLGCFVAASVPFALLYGAVMPLENFVGGWAVALVGYALRWAIELRRLGPAAPTGLPADLARGEWDWASARGWTLRAIFIPLYGISLYGLCYGARSTSVSSLSELLVLAIFAAYTVDLSFALASYVFCSDRLGTGMRSIQPRLWGWVVCLACYTPLTGHWPEFTRVVHVEVQWPGMVDGSATVVGAAVLLVTLPLYISATVVFGLRFSNLSNRGVITSGPYRLMKHPAYFAHAVNCWTIVWMFLGISVGTATVLVVYTGLYRLRATTEERHMAEEPDYRVYSAWIVEHGLLALLRRPFRRTKTIVVAD